jgi:hypothetical protein
MPTNEIQTPRVDAQMMSASIEDENENLIDCDVVKASFARQLERELLDYKTLHDGARKIIGEESGHAVDAALIARHALIEAIGLDAATETRSIKELILLVKDAYQSGLTEGLAGGLYWKTTSEIYPQKVGTLYQTTTWYLCLIPCFPIIWTTYK